MAAPLIPGAYWAGAAALAAAAGWWYASSSQEAPELRIAVFGERESGKTTLLASFFGNQQQNSFEERFGYRLEAVDLQQRNTLLAHFHQLVEGRFPQGTDKFVDYKFELKIRDLPKPGLRITWYDYPGEWWEKEPETPTEEKVRLDAFRRLLECDCGFLIVDGKEYNEQGISYLKALLDRFRASMRKAREHFEAVDTVDVIPKQWILAISKADLLPSGATAESLGRLIAKEASDGLEGICKAGKIKKFGDKFLLLSSVKAEGSKVINAEISRGLQLIAPVAFLALVEQEANSSNALITATGNLADIVKHTAALLSAFKGKLPEKLEPFAALLSVLGEAASKTAGHFHEQQKKEKEPIKAAALAMTAELAEPASRALYFNTGR